MSLPTPAEDLAFGLTQVIGLPGLTEAAGNPLPPPDGPGHGQMQNGQQPPEPPKDENGNPLPPPDGSKAPATSSSAAS